MTDDPAVDARDEDVRESHMRDALKTSLKARQQQQQRLPAKETGPGGTRNIDGCALFEMVQYHCRLMSDHVACKPVERFFRRCPGRPSVEVTHVVSTDRMGNVYLSDSMKKVTPPAHHWHEL